MGRERAAFHAWRGVQRQLLLEPRPLWRVSLTVPPDVFCFSRARESDDCHRSGMAISWLSGPCCAHSSSVLSVRHRLQGRD